MGRDVAGLRIDKKPNVVDVKSNGVSHDKVHFAPKVSGESIEVNDHEVEDHTAKDSLVEECHEEEDVLGVKSTNCELGLPEGKTLKSEALKSFGKKLSSPVKSVAGSAAAGNQQTNSPVPQPTVLATEKQVSTVTHSRDKTVDAGVNGLSKTTDFHSPKSAKKSQPNSPSMSRKLLQADHRKHPDEEDNWSVASSAAASIRTLKSRITIPVAPTFKCAERVGRRKEFYSKLEEKHQALEVEKFEYQERTKEEEEAAIKQLRKTMVFKANPVPSFYHEGPPPKVELKKLPLTRAKSPKLTRRKSCGDAVKSSSKEKGVDTVAKRCSIGIYKEGSTTTSSPKSKDQIAGWNVNGSSKVKDRPKQVRETTKTAPNKLAEERSADIAVQS